MNNMFAVSRLVSVGAILTSLQRFQRKGLQASYTEGQKKSKIKILIHRGIICLPQFIPELPLNGRSQQLKGIALGWFKKAQHILHREGVFLAETYCYC